MKKLRYLSFIAGLSLLAVGCSSSSHWEEAWQAFEPDANIEGRDQGWVVNGAYRIKPLAPTIKSPYWPFVGNGVVALQTRFVSVGDQSLSLWARLDTGNKASGLYLFLCADSPAGAGRCAVENGYAFKVHPSEGISIQSYAAGKTVLLASAALPPGVLNGSLVVKASKKGHRLSLSLNDKVYLEAQDQGFKGGFAGFGVDSGGPSSPIIVRAKHQSQGFKLVPRPFFAVFQGGSVLLPERSWEEQAVFEPSPIADGEGLLMSYTGGWEKPAIGLARSMDGLHWERQGLHPVIGQGYGGESGSAARSHLLKVDGAYRLYYSDKKGEIRWALSKDGKHFQRQPGPVISAGSAPEVVAWASMGLVREGKRWWALVDGQYDKGVDWRLHLFKSEDEGRTFAHVAGPLDSLSPGPGSYGSPRALFKTEQGFEVWYLASDQRRLLPTVLWHASSQDLIHWIPDKQATLRIPGASLGLFMPDQVADPAIVEWQEKAHLYFDTVDNTYGHARIGVALGAGGLKEAFKQFHQPKN